MPWTTLTGRSLLCNRAWSVVHKFRCSGSLQSRYLAANAADDDKEQTAPWDNTWSEYEVGRRSKASPPKSRSISFEPAPKASIDRGVSINKRGQLKVISRVEAEKECHAALILSAASTHLTKDDFTRLVPEDDRMIEGGFEAAIPGRDPQSLERLPYWILLFKTPFLAASFQSRLRWYHQNAVENLPVNPLQAALTPHRGLTPPPGYIDPQSGEDIWKRLREYCLLQPAQDFCVTALLPEFPPSVKKAIQRHQIWTDSPGIRSWSVRIQVEDDHLGVDQISRFLKEDGKAQFRPWNVIHRPSPGICEHEEPIHGVSMAVSEEGGGGHEAEGVKNFIVKFRSEGEAMRFWRTWHRRPCPHLANDVSTPRHQAPLLRVEIIC